MVSIEEDERANDKVEQFKYAILSAFPNRPKLYRTLFPRDEDEETFQYEEEKIEDWTDIQDVMQLINTTFPANESEV